MTLPIVEPKRCPVCSCGPAYGPLPDPTPHAAWCSNYGRAFYGPTPSAPMPAWVQRARANTLPPKDYTRA